jgi:hypothetical protein
VAHPAICGGFIDVAPPARCRAAANYVGGEWELPMRGRAHPVEDRAMHVRARLLAALVLAVLAATSVLAPSAGAQATPGAAALVTARVAPLLAVFVAGDGSLGITRTVDMTVRRERLGRTVIVTVIPRI